jgi:hypothetical protein
MGWPRIKRGAGKRRVDAKAFRLADEVCYIQRRAAEHDSRIVTVGPLLLFSAESGDAWLLDVSDQLAAPIARDGDPLPVHIEESDTNLSVAWLGSYRIDADTFTYREKDTGRARSIIGYPTREIVRQISNMFG